ncbi:MAG: hypothetical protein NVS9B4_03320 [Candidatus Acidiferrum sp.]
MSTFRHAGLSLLVLALSVPLAAQDEVAKSKKESKKERKSNVTGTPVIWHQTTDTTTLNLLYGLGGAEEVPDPNVTYKFLKEDMNGSNPKFDVEDEHGNRWRVKLGEEAQAETSASRLLWAAGYFVDQDYYLAEIKVKDLPKLRRGQSLVSSDGVVHGARLKRRAKGNKKVGTWSWYKNPFLGTKEFNGLRVMMSLLNNWDLKEENNSIYEVEGEQRYLVTDLGASFGKTGDTITRSKNVVHDYEASKFIDKVSADHVDFVMHERPFILTVFDLPHYVERTHMQGITKHIPRSDAKWLGSRLSQLSEEQIRDCFRAGGYKQEEIERYAHVIQKRIAELNAL